MNRRYIYVGVLVVVIGLFATALVLRPAPAERPGIEHDDNGRGHAVTSTYGGEAPPTSGDHGDTVAWGVHTEAVADANVLHNLEHGGIYISYRPDISKDDIAKIEKLFSVPSSKNDFNPAKAVVAPRAANTANIVISSWNRSEVLTSFDEAVMYEYYVQNFNKSPEPFGN